MSRAAAVTLALLLPLCASGCAGTCDTKLLFEQAKNGKLRAIHEVGELGNPTIPSARSAVPPMTTAFAVLAERTTASDGFERVAVVEALRRLGSRSVATYRIGHRDLFDPLLSDSLPEVRWRTAWALGRMELSSDALRAAMRDPDERVAERAVWAVGRARDKKAEVSLLQSLDREGMVQAQAMHALRRITGLKFDTADAWRESAAKHGVGKAKKQ
jgi:hypothetical protein